jgi:predicted RNase H-like HicB family nuclease
LKESLVEFKAGVKSVKPLLRIPLRAVFYKEGDFWIAHCLEFDVLGHGQTKAEALKLLSEAITIQIESAIKYNNIRNLFSAADPKYHVMFALGKDAVIGKLEVHRIDHVTIENLDTREYSETDADLVTSSW